MIQLTLDQLMVELWNLKSSLENLESSYLAQGHQTQEQYDLNMKQITLLFNNLQYLIEHRKQGLMQYLTNQMQNEFPDLNSST